MELSDLLDIPLEKLRAELAKRELAEWSVYTNPNYIVANPHKQLIDALERVERGECKRLMVFMPPRVGKSEAVSVNFPSWYLGRNPDKRIILSSYGASLAYVQSRKARDLLDAFGQEVFKVSVAQGSKAVDEWNIEGHRGGLAAVGVDGPATGKGADLLIIDDPVKDMSDALSEAEREKKKSWYQAVARTRLHPGGAIVLLQTRWHEDDLAGWLLKEAQNGGEQWEVLCLPMVNPDKTLLWPERYDQKEVDAIRVAVGSVAWSALYQQEPVSQDGGMFKRAWWKRYKTLPHPSHIDEWGASMDCSFKETKKADPYVIQVWAKSGANCYLVFSLRKVGDYVDAKSDVERVKRLFPQIGAFLVEDTANGPAIISSLRNTVPGLIAVNPGSKGKPARAASVTPWCEAGNVWIPVSNEYAPIKWETDVVPGDPVELFVNELASFPKGKNDDQVDALSQQLNRWKDGVSDTPVMPLPSRPKPKGLDR
jgi:predicted phage terminase large subunit-like protein